MSAYRLSKLAQQDLDRIWDHLTEKAGVESAERFLWRFHDVLALLAQQPRMGRLSPRIARGVRKFPLDAYLIYYTVAPGKLLVARVLHGKRRQRKAYRQP